MAKSLHDSWDESTAVDDVDGMAATDILRAFGYEPDIAGTTPVFDSSELCTRCGKKVYPVEKLDVGVIYHRGCFKCRVCSLQLTLKTFHLEADTDIGYAKDVYCSVHVPRQIGGNLSGEALGIKSAVDAQKRTSQWLHKSTPEAARNYKPTYIGYENSPWQQSKRVAKQQPTLASFEEFERHGVFDAQADLEQRHRDEEDDLYKQIFDARTEHVRALDKSITEEKLRTVRELVAWFEENGWSPKDRETGMKQVEDYFKKYKQKKLQELLRRLDAEEESAVARMVEKHSQEMLMLISGKEQELRDNRENEQFDEEVSAINDLEDAASGSEPEGNSATSDSDQANALTGITTNTEDDAMFGKHNQAFSDSYEDLGSFDPAVAVPSDAHMGDTNLSYLPDSPEVVHSINDANDDQSVPSVVAAETLKQADQPVAQAGQFELSDLSKYGECVGEHSSSYPEATSTTKISRFPDVSPDQTSRDSSRREDAKPRTIGHTTRGRPNDGTAAAATVISISVNSRENLRDSTRKRTVQRDSFQSITSAKSIDARLEDFDTFDTQAIKEATKDHATFTDLVRRLSHRCQTQLQKVRAIFRWITVKDLNKIDLEKAADSDTPMGLLRGIKLGTESYHTLFKRLCSYAGLVCEIINGYSKGAGYRPGAVFRDNTFRNQWTAVSVDGTWRFINCNWGARHVRQSGVSEHVYRCDEFYFLTDPEDHIYQHFPDNPEWQLLREPISIERFIQLPVIKSPFFNNYLAFAERYTSVIHSSDGFAEVRLLASHLAGLAVKLKSKNNRVPSDVLKERVLIRRIDAEVIFTVCLPALGQYIMEVYIDSQWHEGSMDIACAFRINCDEVKMGVTNISYPPVPCFGRTALWMEMGLAEVTHVDPYVEHSEELAIVISVPAGIKVGHMLQRWKTRDKVFKNFDRFALVMSRDNESMTYLIRCPERGLYVLTLYAAWGKEEELKCVYRYLIHCRTPAVDALPMATASKRWQNCRLISPLHGDIGIDSDVRFDIESSQAVAVAVNVNGSHWKSLEKVQEDRWQATVHTGDRTGTLSVYGQFDLTRKKLIPLLEYHIIDT